MKSGFEYVFIGLLLALLISTGCVGKTEPAVFYSLDPVVPEKSANSNGTATGEALLIGLGPIEFPDYLDRPQIVTRNSPNELDIAEFRRWAGPLPENFTQTLSEDLAIFLATDNVFVYPWPPQVEVTYRVLVDVYRFEGNPGGAVNLVARWILLAGKDEAIQAVRKSRITEPVRNNRRDPYSALVAAKSRAVAALAGEIAEEIRKPLKQSSPGVR